MSITWNCDSCSNTGRVIKVSLKNVCCHICRKQRPSLILVSVSQLLQEVKDCIDDSSGTQFQIDPKYLHKFFEGIKKGKKKKKKLEKEEKCKKEIKRKKVKYEKKEEKQEKKKKIEKLRAKVKEEKEENNNMVRVTKHSCGSMETGTDTKLIRRVGGAPSIFTTTTTTTVMTSVAQDDALSVLDLSPMTIMEGVGISPRKRLEGKGNRDGVGVGVGVGDEGGSGSGSGSGIGIGSGDGGRNIDIDVKIDGDGDGDGDGVGDIDGGIDVDVEGDDKEGILRFPCLLDSYDNNCISIERGVKGDEEKRIFCRTFTTKGVDKCSKREELSKNNSTKNHHKNSVHSLPDRYDNDCISTNKAVENGIFCRTSTYKGVNTYTGGDEVSKLNDENDHHENSILVESSSEEVEVGVGAYTQHHDTTPQEMQVKMDELYAREILIEEDSREQERKNRIRKDMDMAKEMAEEMEKSHLIRNTRRHKVTINLSSAPPSPTQKSSLPSPSLCEPSSISRLSSLSKKDDIIPTQIKDFLKPGVDHSNQIDLTVLALATSADGTPIGWTCSVCPRENNLPTDLRCDTCGHANSRRTTRNSSRKGTPNTINWNESLPDICTIRPLKFRASLDKCSSNSNARDFADLFADRLYSYVYKNEMGTLNEDEESDLSSPLAIRNTCYPPILIKPSYFKVHLIGDKNQFMQDIFRSIVPPTYCPKMGAKRVAMAFLNYKDCQSETHYDADTSILYVVRGHKEIMISPNQNKIGLPSTDTSTVENFDPFSPDVCEEDKNNGNKRNLIDWYRLSIGPGDALLIPRSYTHAVKSKAGTIAISIQIESASISTVGGCGADRARDGVRSDTESINFIPRRGKRKQTSNLSPVTLKKFQNVLQSNIRELDARKGEEEIEIDSSTRRKCMILEKKDIKNEEKYTLDLETTSLSPSKDECRVFKRPRRVNISCGKCNKIGFLKNGGTMWVLSYDPLDEKKNCIKPTMMLTNKTVMEGHQVEGNQKEFGIEVGKKNGSSSGAFLSPPCFVPTKIPMHALCFSCHPKECSTLQLDKVQKSLLRKEMESAGLDLTNFTYRPLSHVDYEFAKNGGGGLYGRAGEERPMR